jgi:hypothetical protein
MNKINLQNVQFLMPNNFRKYPLKQEQFKDFQALLYKLKDFQGLEFLFSDSRIFKFCTNPVSPCIIQVVASIRSFLIDFFSLPTKVSQIEPYLFKGWLTPNMIFSMCNIWVILRRNVMYLYSKKPHLDQLFHCQSLRIWCHLVNFWYKKQRKNNLQFT